MASIDIRIGFVVIVILSSLCEGSEKQGLAAGRKQYKCGDLSAYSKVNWWYDWGLEGFPKSNCSELPRFRPRHVPMQWGKWNIDKLSVPRDAEALLGFNEPNHAKQAHLTPRQAADLWPKLEKAAAGIPLVSPAASPCGSPPPKCNGTDIEWFDEFFKACVGCRVDYLATHLYSCNAGRTMQKMQFLYKRYGLRLWLTELACPRTDSPAKELRYMRKVIPLLDEADYVHKYSWFASRITSTSGFVTDAASLLEPKTSELTELGHQYDSYSNRHEKSFRREKSSRREKATGRLRSLLEEMKDRIDVFFSALAKKLGMQRG